MLRGYYLKWKMNCPIPKARKAMLSRRIEQVWNLLWKSSISSVAIVYDIDLSLVVYQSVEQLSAKTIVTSVSGYSGDMCRTVYIIKSYPSNSGNI